VPDRVSRSLARSSGAWERGTTSSAGIRLARTPRAFHSTREEERGIQMPMDEMSMHPEMGVRREMGMSPHGGGHLYMQTNESRNAIVHYRRSANGTLTEVERVLTGGAGSGTFKPISGQESAPNSFEGAASVILSPDRKLLFATNGGDNSVSSFAVGDNGRLR